tara:strand:- start:3740 stop:3952 length:213 start_codon:yes stop_codon:yes gene_type:complete
MREYGMFSKSGDLLVGNIVEQALAMKESEGVERVWDWCLSKLEVIASAKEFEEATDTAVREAVYSAVVCG